MPGWSLWLILAVVLTAAEALSPVFVAGPIAVAAVATALAALAGGNAEIQVATFAVVSALSLLIVRPIARRHLRRPPVDKRTNVPALVGKEALVVKLVDRDQGQVKVEGEVWSARTAQPEGVFEAGQRVVISSVHSTVLRVSQPTADETSTTESG